MGFHVTFSCHLVNIELPDSRALIIKYELYLEVFYQPEFQTLHSLLPCTFVLFQGAAKLSHNSFSLEISRGNAVGCACNTKPNPVPDTVKLTAKNSHHNPSLLP